MKGQKINGQFVPLPRQLVVSTAWRAASLNARHMLDHLIEEHLRHGGKSNGILLAPRRQLEQLIHRNAVTNTINELQRLGLIDLKPGLGRTPSTYTLTWLPHADGSPPTDRWHQSEAENYANSLIAARKQAKTRPKRHARSMLATIRTKLLKRL